MVSVAKLSYHRIRRIGVLKKLASSLSTASGAPWTMRSGKDIGKVEKLVGYPSPLLRLQQLIGSELTHLPSQVQRLLSSQHPIVKRARLFFERSETSYSHGLLTLLVSKALNVLNPMLPDIDQFGILPQQRALAEIAEMIHMANLIQSEVIDLGSEGEEENRELAFGNKLIILGGDMLLARACKELALLYNPQIIALMSQAISDMMTGAYYKPTHLEFMERYESSSINNITDCSDTSVSAPDPYCEILSDPSMALDYQSLYSSYCHFATLLSNSCQSCAIMAELDDYALTVAAIFGRQLSIAKQAVSGIEKCDRFRKSGKAVKIARHCERIAKEACLKSLDALEHLPDSKPRLHLEEIIVDINSRA